MASFGFWSSSPLLLRRLTLPILPPLSPSSFLQLKRDSLRRLVVIPVKNCSPSGKSKDVEAEPKAGLPSSPFSGNLSTYKWCAGLGGIGFVETAYLSYLKFSDSGAFCPIGGGTCDDVLNSDYASVFGIPLPLIGMIAYGTVASLSLQLQEGKFPFELGISNGRLVLLGMSSSMATASSYFLYILSTKLSGASCLYCLFSALLSFLLFFITLKDLGFKEVQKMVALQLCLASLVIFTLNTAYSPSLSVPSSSAEMAEMPYFTTEITTESSPFTVSLARHLRSIGAKMYGAFWCSHCLEQKQIFGKEAAKILDYVECFPNGYKKGTKIEKACADASIEGFPTWIINGQVCRLAKILIFEFLTLIRQATSIHALSLLHCI
ncbi:hypothetical protein SAY87_029098 [Trapa incisa]|uniref:Vitamin K epoxide reductase domain-containing protein n=1 Tax=Trapa incisa TaxID=236973 RepID=A0AAN7QPE6_9MYRT|nr:hypothetical protein SAY87_029098 [Trapa incisa]